LYLHVPVSEFLSQRCGKLSFDRQTDEQMGAGQIIHHASTPQRRWRTKKEVKFEAFLPYCQQHAGMIYGNSCIGVSTE